MAISDYITCCKCGCKLIYDGGGEQRDWWEERWGDVPINIKGPDCSYKVTNQSESELVEALKDLLEMPEHDGTFSMGSLRKSIKDRAKAIIRNAEQLKEKNHG